MVLNIHSLKLKLDILVDIMDSKKIDICFLTETWLKKNYNDVRTQISNYSYRIFHSQTFGRGKGTAILLKNTLPYKKVETNKYQNFSSFEVVVIHLCNRKSTCLVCIYRYGSSSRYGSSFETFLSEFSKLISEIVVMYNSYLICGDFNIHLNRTSSPQTVKFLDLLDEFDLHTSVPLIPTQMMGNTLDLILSDSGLLNQITNVSVENHLPLLSDHYPIYFFTDIGDSTKLSDHFNQRTVRHYKNIDLEKFQTDLVSITSSNLQCTPDSFAHAISLYNNSLQQCLDKHAPATRSKVVHRDRPSWMDEEYVLERAKRRKFERKYKRTRCFIDKRLLDIQTRICKDLAVAKRTHGLKQKIISHCNSQKSLFSLLNDMSGNSKGHILPDIYGDMELLSNEFNNFFVNKVTNIRDSFPLNTSNNSVHQINIDETLSQTGCLYNFEPSTPDEIKTILKTSGIVVSPADIFPSHLLSKNIEVLVPFITDLVNLSLSTGSIDGLKEAIIRPLLKEHNLDRNVLNNYRPVSNLQFIGKLIERVVLARLQSHMDSINYCNNTQFGYKKQHSTELLLLKFINDILIGVDSRNGVVVMLIDLSAAFDTVNHNKLLNILCTELKIRGIALQWFKSFLFNRSQRVKVGNYISESIELSCGVPQGSVLGPVLFNIYISSLSNVFISNGFNTLSYADDNSGYQVFSLSSESSVFNDFIPDFIDELKLWMDEYFLKINEDKTKIIVFGRPVFHNGFTTTTVALNNGDIIDITDRIKYLSFHFDKFLSMTTHVNKVVSHCYSLLKTVRHIRKFLEKSQVELLMHSIISSRIDYCNVLLFGAQKVNCINKLQRVQDCASKLILRKGHRQGYSSSLRLELLHWLPVEKRIVFKALVVIYKCYCKKAPVSLSSILVRKFPDSTPDDDDFNCDFDDRLYYPNLNVGRRVFAFYAPRLWNVLPMYLRLAVNIDDYKKKLKTYLWDYFDDLMLNFNRFRNM